MCIFSFLSYLCVYEWKCKDHVYSSFTALNISNHHEKDFNFISVLNVNFRFHIYYYLNLNELKIILAACSLSVIIFVLKWLQVRLKAMSNSQPGLAPFPVTFRFYSWRFSRATSVFFSGVHPGPAASLTFTGLPGLNVVSPTLAREKLVLSLLESAHLSCAVRTYAGAPTRIPTVRLAFI